jgi:hypothetical protein
VFYHEFPNTNQQLHQFNATFKRGGVWYMFPRDFKHYNGKKEEIIEEKIVIKEKVEGK